MPIAVAFTLTSLVAEVALIYVQREFLLNRRAVLAGRSNGIGLEAATMLVILLAAILITNTILLLVGVGALLGIRLAGYLLTLIPIVKLIGGLLVVRSLRRQARLYSERDQQR